MIRILFPILGLVTLVACSSTNTSGDRMFLLASSYSDGTTSGISVYDFNTTTGEYTFLSDIKHIVNPSYLAVSTDEQMVYSVNETQEGGVSAFRFDKRKGVLSLVNTQSTKGADPCYISIDKEGNKIVTANYSGGNISVFLLDTDGSIKPLSMNINLTVPDVAASHIHTVVFSPDEKQLLATDLGRDRIYSFEVFQYTLDTIFSLTPDNITLLESGSGPRHLAFHPAGKYLYCINELSGKITVFTYKNYKREAIQTIISDTTQTSGSKGSADIHLTSDGRFLYSSNRLRADGIAIFSVSPDDGKLTYIGYQSTGIHPRNFIISPNNQFLLCANRDTNNIQIFEIDSTTGLLRDTGKEIKLNRPVCLKWVKK